MRKTDAQTRVHAHTLTSEIYFSIQVLDLRGQAELEQVQTVTAGRDTVSKRHMREEVTQEQEKKDIWGRHPERWESLIHIFHRVFDML